MDGPRNDGLIDRLTAAAIVTLVLSYYPPPHKVWDWGTHSHHGIASLNLRECYCTVLPVACPVLLSQHQSQGSGSPPGALTHTKQPLATLFRHPESHARVPGPTPSHLRSQRTFRWTRLRGAGTGCADVCALGGEGCVAGRRKRYCTVRQLNLF